MPVGASYGAPAGRGARVGISWINAVEINGQDGQVPQEIWYFSDAVHNTRTTTRSEGHEPFEYLSIHGETGVNGPNVIRVYMEGAPGWTGQFREDVDLDYVRVVLNFFADVGAYNIAGRIFGTHVETFEAGSVFNMTAMAF